MVRPKVKNFFKNPSLWLGFFSFLALTVAQTKFSYTPEKQPYITPPELKHFTFGYKEVVADSLWIRAIQDFDFCSQKVNERDCVAKSWLYHMIHQITELSPQFRMPYATGALALTILINDYEGATKIFDKAVQQFPTDWPILGRAAYHALYEESDKVKAARLAKQAAENGAPEWYYSMAGRLFAEGGELEFGEALLQQLKDTNQNEKLIARLNEKLEIHRKKAQKTSK